MCPGSMPLGLGLRRCHQQGRHASDISTNKPRDTTFKPFQSHGPSTAAHKRKSFYSVGFKTLFTLSPQENFPVDFRRIYELIKLLFKKACFLQLVSSGELESSFTECLHRRRVCTQPSPGAGAGPDGAAALV